MWSFAQLLSCRRSASEQQTRAITRLIMSAIAVQILSVLAVHAALLSGPAGHTLSSSLTVVGDVNVVTADGTTNNLMQITQQQATLIANQQTLITNQQKVIDNLSAALTSLSARVTSAETNIASQSSNISSLTSHRIAMIASGIPLAALPSTPTNSDILVVFPTVELDTFSAYSSSTGQFTVPVSGAWLISACAFIFTSDSSVTQRTYYQINNIYVDNVRTRQISSAVTSGVPLTTTLHLAVGQKVDFRVTASIPSQIWYASATNFFFSAQLVAP